MKYFLIDTLGNYMDKKLTFINSPPEDLGLNGYCMAEGERIGDQYPNPANIYLQSKHPGIKLTSLIGNTRSYLIVSTAMKDVISSVSTDEIEILPINIYNHKRRLHTTDYWIINPIGSVDCLNKTASTIIYLDDGIQVVSVEKFVLNPQKVEGHDLFRVPEDPRQYFVSSRLVKMFSNHEFTNLLLEEIAVLDE